MRSCVVAPGTCFNPRAREGRDGDITSVVTPEQRFNPRAREGRDFPSTPYLRPCRVSIHAPARGATRWPGKPAPSTKFQSTRPRGARLDEFNRLAARLGRFNPRAREGRDVQRRIVDSAGIWFQSTRPRGARPITTDVGDIDEIVSIHAPARGATASRETQKPLHRRFNPRAREGRDAWDRYKLSAGSVSIHAPARGATFWFGVLICGDWFQSTRPRGARQRHCADFEAVRIVSIHAPARGATTGGPEDRLQDAVSIHAPARGATQELRVRLLAVLFQSTRPRGARPPH